MSDEVTTRRVDATVVGRVQGVGFRYFVLREATELGLRGWVANTAEGAVHCVAEGHERELRSLVARLEAGPPAAIVDHVSVAWMPATGRSGHSACGAAATAAIDRTSAVGPSAVSTGTGGLFHLSGARVILETMEPNTAAKELPGLYRAVLDRVGELSVSGHRDQANQVRAEAVRIYSRAWDDRARRELLALLRRNQDVTTSHPLPERGLLHRFIRAT